MLIITYIFFKTNCSHLKRKQYQRIEREFQEDKGRTKRIVSKCGVKYVNGKGREKETC